MTDEPESNELEVPELERALDAMGEPPDVQRMHEATVDMLSELGVPVDLLDVDVLQFRRELTHESD